jgi:hypothetical protein
VKPKIAKPCVADNKKVRNMLQSIKYRVVTACGQEKQHHTLYSSSNFEKNDVIHRKRVKIPKYTQQPSFGKFLVAADFFFANIFVTKK